MALPVNGSTHLIPALPLTYRPRKDERLSWPSWLTCSGWFTHISGQRSAAGRVQERESSPVRDRRSTTVPRHQLCYVYFSANPQSAEVAGEPVVMSVNVEQAENQLEMSAEVMNQTGAQSAEVAEDTSLLIVSNAKTIFLVWVI